MAPHRVRTPASGRSPCSSHGAPLLALAAARGRHGRCCGCTRCRDRSTVAPLTRPRSVTAAYGLLRDVADLFRSHVPALTPAALAAIQHDLTTAMPLGTPIETSGPVIKARARVGLPALGDSPAPPPPPPTQAMNARPFGYDEQFPQKRPAWKPHL